jgi:hypothetical protein
MMMMMMMVMVMMMIMMMIMAVNLVQRAVVGPPLYESDRIEIPPPSPPSYGVIYQDPPFTVTIPGQ